MERIWDDLQKTYPLVTLDALRDLLQVIVVGLVHPAKVSNQVARLEACRCSGTAGRDGIHLGEGIVERLGDVVAQASRVLLGRRRRFGSIWAVDFGAILFCQAREMLVQVLLDFAHQFFVVVS